MSRKALRLIGGLMAVAGVAILLYAVYAYFSQRQLEAELTAQIPGQVLSGEPTITPVVLAPAANSASTTSVAVAGALILSPSVTPIPAHVTPVQPDATSAANVLSTATAISLTPRTPVPLSTRTGAQSVAAPTTAPTRVSVNAAAPSSLGKPRGTGPDAIRLMIPKLNMDLGVEPAPLITFNQGGQLVTDWDVPFDAAGHLNTTVQPGEIGNAVLSGHHNLKAPNEFGLGVFAGIWNLAIGDEIHVQTEDGKEQLWRVKETFPIKEGGEPLSVRVKNAQQIMSDTALPTLTLLTCWNGKSNPLSGNTYRWVIHAELVNIN